LASVATVSLFGPTTTAAALPPALETASSTWASNDWPAILCSTFGRAERMRVPSPAASTMARQVRSLTKGCSPGRIGRPAPSYPSAPQRKRRNARASLGKNPPDPSRDSSVAELSALRPRAGEGPPRPYRGLLIVPVETARHSAPAMQFRLFLPTARQTNWLLLVGLLSLGEALYLRYLAIEYAQVSLACQGGLGTWLCATFRLAIGLYNHSVFGWVALGVAALNLVRPSVVLVLVALPATAFGPRLHQSKSQGEQSGGKPQRLPIRETLVAHNVDGRHGQGDRHCLLGRRYI